MKITASVLGIILVAGFAVAAYKMNDRASAPTSESDSGDYFDASAATDDRIRALEVAVAQERNARQLLEEELRVLYAEIEELGDARGAEEARDEPTVAEALENRVAFDASRRMRPDNSLEGRRTALTNAGFAPDRAEWIIQRESQLQLEAMQARFDARRSGEPMDPFGIGLNPDLSLRAELGDIEYEQYLAANGRPTAVHISSVMESSPGQVAGLQSGDRITGYDGLRVFSTMELTQQTMQGEPSESVVVDIVRDGAPMQIVLPRDPIGVITGRRSRGR
jgi:hypothetical protein